MTVDAPAGDACHLGLPVAPDDLTYGRFVATLAARHGDRTALVLGDQRVGYAELHRQARAFGRGLLARGVTKGTKVALLLGNRPEFAVAAFGAALVGAVVVPMSTLAAAGERDYVLAHSDAAVLVAQPRLLARRFLDELLGDHPALGTAEPGRIAVARFPHLRRIVGLGPGPGPDRPDRSDRSDRSDRRSVEAWDDVIGTTWGSAGGLVPIDDAVLDAAAASVHPTDDALIIYTSGTTDHPKAVLHRHRGPVVQSWRWAEQLRLDPDDRVWSPFPFFWTAGLAMVLGGTLASGACLVCQDGFAPGPALELIERERVTTVHAFPHVAAQLVEHEDARRRDLSSIRRVMHDSPLRQLPGLTGLTDHAGDPGAAYGLTETFTIATSIPSDSPLELRRTTHGVALPGMAVRIVDPADGATLGVGETGEIAVRGVTLMRGYYKVAPEDCLDDQGWFRTRDSGHLDERGYLHWAGRLSSLIKTAGANVSPGEVEAALRWWGRLSLAGVVGVPHPTLGEAVVLCAVAGHDPVTGDEVTAHLRTVLASYKVPRRVLFVDEAEVVLTGNQKVRLDDLRALAIRRVAESPDTDAAWVAHLRDHR